MARNEFLMPKNIYIDIHIDIFAQITKNLNFGQNVASMWPVEAKSGQKWAVSGIDLVDPVD